ncbi:MAG: hypothetical protein ACK5LR_01825 [Mangrovibacterium sp.]
MTTKVSCVYQQTPNGKMNGLVQSLQQQGGYLLGEASAYFSELTERISSTQEELNELIMLDRVRSQSKQNMIAMKSAYQDLLRFAQVSVSFCSSASQPYAQQFCSLVSNYERKILFSTQHLTCDSYVTSLIADLGTAEMQGFVESIMYASTLLNKLKAAQEKFITHHASFHYERKQQVNAGNATTMKMTLLQLINQELVGYLNTMLRVDASTYGDYAAAIDSVIKAHNVVMKRKIKATKEAEVV